MNRSMDKQGENKMPSLVYSYGMLHGPEDRRRGSDAPPQCRRRGMKALESMAVDGSIAQLTGRGEEERQRQESTIFFLQTRTMGRFCQCGEGRILPGAVDDGIHRHPDRDLLHCHSIESGSAALRGKGLLGQAFRHSGCV